MKIIQFFKECYAELKKVIWPSRDSVVSSVIVVLISTAIISLILFVIDLLLTKGVDIIF